MSFKGKLWNSLSTEGFISHNSLSISFFLKILYPRNWKQNNFPPFTWLLCFKHFYSYHLPTNYVIFRTLCLLSGSKCSPASRSLKIYYRVHTGRPKDSILSRTNFIHVLKPFRKLHLNPTPWKRSGSGFPITMHECWVFESHEVHPFFLSCHHSNDCLSGEMRLLNYGFLIVLTHKQSKYFLPALFQ